MRWVIHAAVMGPDLKTDADAIARATRSALEVADKCRARSLAMPAFGTGVGGFPIYQCASIMMAEVVRYLKDHPRTGLRQVMFSVYNDSAKAAFKNAMAGISRLADWRPAPARPRRPRRRRGSPPRRPYTALIRKGAAWS